MCLCQFKKISDIYCGCLTCPHEYADVTVPIFFFFFCRLLLYSLIGIGFY